MTTTMIIIAGDGIRCTIGKRRDAHCVFVFGPRENDRRNDATPPQIVVVVRVQSITDAVPTAYNARSPHV